MSLIDPTDYDTPPFLLVNSVEFSQVVALPERQLVPEGELYTFRFANGYGALVIRVHGVPQHQAFEFCVLDCTLSMPAPTFSTPLADGVLSQLSHEQTGHLLVRAEQLTPHPYLQLDYFAGEDF